MSKILETIVKSKAKCMIIPHQSPDGDCLGSSYALSMFFEYHNCEHIIVMDDLIPTNFSFLRLDNMMTSEEVIASKRNFDYIIILDTSSLDRVGASKEVLGLDGVKVVIDHHKTNSYFGDINIVEPVSSVGELLYNLFSQMNQTLNQEMAKGLYTSIVTDTGEFRYSNTEASTLRAVATLIETGFDFGKVSQEIFSNIPKKKMLLQSHAISLGNSYFNDKVFVSKVTQDMIQSLECEMFHSDGIVEMGRDIEGVEVSILLKEVDNATVKVSMRSKSYVDVSEVSLVFSGGGHARAAGCTVNEPIDQVEKKLIDLFKGLV